MGEKLNPAGGGGGGRGIGGIGTDASGFHVGMRVKGDICRLMVHISANDFNHINGALTNILRVSGAVSIFRQIPMIKTAIRSVRRVGVY